MSRLRSCAPLVNRPLALSVLLLARASSASELQLATRNTRESLGQKPQWAPSGNFWALHGRSISRGEIRSESRPYARARGEVASGIGIFLSRSSVGRAESLNQQSLPGRTGPQ